MKLFVAALLAILPLAGQGRFTDFARDLKHQAPGARAAIIESGRVVWQNGEITAPAPEEPVIAERIPRSQLASPAPIPPGATILQVLSNTADGTPGEEVLENREFFKALHTVGDLPNAVRFAQQPHGTLGWFVQNYEGERVVWSYGPSVLIVRIPSKKLALVFSGNLTAARLEDGNVARAVAALLFLRTSWECVERNVMNRSIRRYLHSRRGIARRPPHWRDSL